MPKAIVRLVFILTLVSLLSACATQQNIDESVQVADKLQLRLPMPNQISMPLQVEQLLTFSNAKRNDSVQVIYKNDHKVLSVTGVSPMVGVLFSMAYDGKKISSDTTLVKEMGDLRYVLADIVMVGADRQQLKSWLSPGSRVVDTKSTAKEPASRQIFSGKQLVIEVSYSKQSPWQGVVHFTHLQRGYKLKIENLGVKKL